MPLHWHSLLLIIAALCMGMCSSQSQPQCITRLYDVVSLCFKNQNLSLHTHSGQQDPTTIMQETQALDPALQCQHADQFKTAIACALESVKDCLSHVGMAGAIPDTDKFKQGMDVVCQRLDDLDAECMKRHYNDIMQCGQEVVKRVVERSENSKFDDIEAIICLSADVNYDCSKELLKTCGKQTLDVYLEQLNKYQLPSACADSPPGRSGRVAYDVYGTGGSNSASDSAVLTVTAAVASLALFFRL